MERNSQPASAKLYMSLWITRPPATKSTKALNQMLLYTFLPRDLWSPRPRGVPSKVDQRLDPTSGTKKNHPDISPVHSKIFTGVQKCEIWKFGLDFWPLCFEWLWLRNGAISRKCRTFLGSPMIGLFAPQIQFSSVHCTPRTSGYKIALKRAGKICWIINNSAMRYPILLKFGRPM